jgi:hypothetical protein
MKKRKRNLPKRFDVTSLPDKLNGEEMRACQYLDAENKRRDKYVNVN